MLKRILITIFLACNVPSYATADSINQSSWSQAEIRHEQAMKNYKAVFNQIPKRFIQLTKKNDENVINDSAYRQGILLLMDNIFEVILIELDTSIALDQAFLKALDDGAFNTQKGQKILSDQHKKIVQSREENKKLLTNNSLSAIMEREIANAYGDDAVPFKLKSKAAKICESVDKTLKELEDKLSSDYAKLIVVGSNVHDVRSIIKGSLKFKADISFTLSNLAKTIDGFQPLEAIPDINAIAQGAQRNATNLDETISVIGMLFSGYLDSMFGKNVNVDIIEYNNEPEAPDTLRENIQDFMPYGKKVSSKS